MVAVGGGVEVQVVKEGAAYCVTFDVRAQKLPLMLQPSDSPTAIVGGYQALAFVESPVRFTLATQRRHYFHYLDPQGRPMVAAERRLAFEGTPNFRDMGGYRSADGRAVLWGRLYRSGRLSALTDSDVQAKAELGLALVFDFRRGEEQIADPSRYADSQWPQVVSLPITPGSSASFFDNLLHSDIDADSMERFMCAINRDFVLENHGEYRQMFQHLLALENGAALVHCAAGKDRTGFAAAMILSALGVPRTTILHDYTLSADYFSVEAELQRMQTKYQWSGNAAAMRPMLETRPYYLEAAFEAIDSNFASVEDYLASMLGVGDDERACLRARYLS